MKLRTEFKLRQLLPAYVARPRDHLSAKRRKRRAPGARAAFTLAEVLAALAFMAIVIPVAVRGLQIANRAGVVAQRKAMAARVGERLLNEVVVARQWNQGTQSGVEKAGPYDFHWTLHNQPWLQISTNQATTSSSITGVNQNVVTSANIHELSVDVIFSAQGQNYTVHLATLVDTTLPSTGTTMPQL
jgi:type II secretory pathway pseudopilin PulG